jgi:NAD(P)-dependent dehydrogenase (short-subunit alcohol dehydrogenase family)
MTTLNTITIVTGASRGRGAEVPQRLAKDGFTVINYAESASSPKGLFKKNCLGRWVSHRRSG